MISGKSPFGQQTLAVMYLFVAIGVLSTTWPAIIALVFSVFLFVHSLGVEQEIVFLSWTEIGHAPILLASLRSPELLTTLD